MVIWRVHFSQTVWEPDPKGTNQKLVKVESTPHHDGHALTEVESLTEDEEKIADEVFVAAETCVVDDYMDVAEVVDNDSSQSTIADNTVSSFIHFVQFDN